MQRVSTQPHLMERRGEAARPPPAEPACGEQGEALLWSRNKKGRNDRGQSQETMAQSEPDEILNAAMTYQVPTAGNVLNGDVHALLCKVQ